MHPKSNNYYYLSVLRQLLSMTLLSYKKTKINESKPYGVFNRMTKPYMQRKQRERNWGFHYAKC